MPWMFAAITEACRGFHYSRSPNPKSRKSRNSSSSLNPSPPAHSGAASQVACCQITVSCVYLRVTESPGYHQTSMHCRALPIEALPHQPQLLRDYVNSYERVGSFFQHQPNLESILSVARALDFPADRRRDVAGILRQQNELLGSGAETRANLERLENGAVAIVSGQIT